MPGSSTGAVLEKPSTILTRTESEPQLGGEGSGFPPRFLIATGSLGHSIIGIDIGSHWTRVASVVQNEPRLISPPVSSLLSLMGVDIATDSVVQIGPEIFNARTNRHRLGPGGVTKRIQNEHRGTFIGRLFNATD